MPGTLDETYEQSLRRIDKQKRDFACRLFQCLVVSKRPLRVEELAELFAIDPDVDMIATFDARWRPESPEEFILSTCPTLVAVVDDWGRKIVQFSHFSVREYLTSDRIAISEHVSRFHVLPRPAHVLLARACLSVLLQLDGRIVREEIQDFPLASYAATYWVDHAQFDDVASEIQHGMECLFDKDKPHFAAWLQVHDIDGRYMHLHLVPLYYAALCGFRHLAEHLVDAHPRDVDAQGGLRVTPLHAAVYKGYLGVATLLLERGADPNAERFDKETPLHTASRRGFIDIVRSLLYYGADSNHPNAFGITPLYDAVLAGHDEIIQLLLDLPDSNSWTVLPAASREGYKDVVGLLLDRGADANNSDGDGWTVLHTASQEGHVDIVRSLLDHGADANRSDSEGWIPLHTASQEGHYTVVRMLLDHGAVADHPARDGWTPLQAASHESHDDIVRLLLDYGATPNY